MPSGCWCGTPAPVCAKQGIGRKEGHGSGDGGAWAASSYGLEDTEDINGRRKMVVVASRIRGNGSNRASMGMRG